MTQLVSKDTVARIVAPACLGSILQHSVAEHSAGISSTKPGAIRPIWREKKNWKTEKLSCYRWILQRSIWLMTWVTGIFNTKVNRCAETWIFDSVQHVPKIHDLHRPQLTIFDDPSMPWSSLRETHATDCHSGSFEDKLLREGSLSPNSRISCATRRLKCIHAGSTLATYARTGRTLCSCCTQRNWNVKKCHDVISHETIFPSKLSSRYSRAQILDFPFATDLSTRRFTGEPNYGKTKVILGDSYFSPTCMSFLTSLPFDFSLLHCGRKFGFCFPSVLNHTKPKKPSVRVSASGSSLLMSRPLVQALSKLLKRLLGSDPHGILGCAARASPEPVRSSFFGFFAPRPGADPSARWPWTSEKPQPQSTTFHTSGTVSCMVESWRNCPRNLQAQFHIPVKTASSCAFSCQLSASSPHLLLGWDLKMLHGIQTHKHYRHNIWKIIHSVQNKETMRNWNQLKSSKKCINCDSSRVFSVQAPFSKLKSSLTRRGCYVLFWIILPASTQDTFPEALCEEKVWFSVLILYNIILKNVTLMYTYNYNQLHM